VPVVETLFIIISTAVADLNRQQLYGIWYLVGIFLC